MRVLRNIFEYNNTQPTVLTIGAFDGVHLGHQKILTGLKRCAVEKKIATVVLSFFPHPRKVVQNNLNMGLLNSISEKEKLIERQGIDFLIIHPFDEYFAQITPEDFVKEVLVKTLNVQKIIIGYDHRFGKDRAAGIQELRFFGQKYGFEVEEIGVKEVDTVSVSSTKIRKALQEGNIKEANQFLGYAYGFDAQVVRGNQLGRTIGFPTANLEPLDKDKIIPFTGVYIVKVLLRGEVYKGMMNIGNRPTIEGDKLTYEVHILDFEEDIYDCEVRVEFEQRIRNEQKFESLDHLKLQLHQDLEQTKAYTIYV
ncbi:MAG: bifunctional riboflavin kinase/FAD synthetase [Bacteroidota bacterium]|nr:bifunctional riboflavin kinase/FAD synthetase [Bacteroidota bacterium]